ncbi:MAG: D-alanine--D-alanine ligase family protein [Chitinophagales bacterium]
MRVAVILGGRSSEREVSLQTGQNIITALRQKGHETVALDLTDDLALLLRQAKPDTVYIALHGEYGEDGCLQGLLEMLGLPYVGSGVLASALGMDKYMSRRIMELEGLPVPATRAIRRDEALALGPRTLAAEVKRAFGVPLVVKPNRQGSTVGVTIVREESQLEEALRTALEFDELALVEEFLSGKELTVGVLGDRPPEALPVIEIVPKTAFYDYEAKYTPGMSEHIIPARISPEVAAAAQDYAVRAYRALGCRHYARVDLMLNDLGQPVVLEVNTLPGMTSTSLVPDAARSVGIEFPDLVERLVKMSLGSE